MATKKVQVVEINEGTKINYEQSGYKLFFGDDEIMVNCSKYQKDWPVHLDICADKSSNLVIGVGEGRYYVAQIDIPATEYTEAETTETTENGESVAETAAPEPKPLNMADVILTLWSIDDLTPARD